MFKLQSQQKRMIIGSKQYNQTARKISSLRGIMQKHNNQLRQTEKRLISLRGAAEKFNRYSMMIGSAVASIVGLVMGFRKATDAANMFEERLDNLSALTGLEGRELEWLGDTAKKTSIEITESGIRIKQSAADILEAYKIVGSQRPELLKIKEDLHSVTKDAIILSEAAKSDLKPAVAGLTMAMNQFNLGATETNRIINAMAAGSKLGAADIPYLTQAIEKSGTTMDIMNLSLEDNIALIETIAPSYSQASQAGNSLDKTFLRMRAQGIGLKDGVFDISTALEELKYRFENGESAVDLFGLRHAKMAEILVKNRKEFIRYREGITGTNIAIEQAQKNTDNVATKIAQAKNKLNLTLIQFGEKISPVFLKSTNLVNYLIKALVKLPKFYKENQILLLSLAGALAVYNSALIKNIGLSTANMALKAKDLILDKTRIITVNAKAIATRVMIGVTPVGMVVAAIAALVVAIKAYDKYSRQAKQRTEEKEKALKSLARVNNTYKQQQEGLQQSTSNLNRLSRERKQAIQDEIEKTIQLAEAELVLQQTKQKEIKQHNTQATLWQKAAAIARYGTLQWGKIKQKASEQAKENGLAAAAELQDGIDALQEKITGLKRQGTDIDNILNAEKIGDEIGTSTIVELEEKLGKYQTALKNVIKGSEDYVRIQQKINQVEKELNQTRSESQTISTFENTKKALESSFKQELNILKEQLLLKKITQSEFNREQYLLELAHLTAMRQLYRQWGEDITSIEGNIIDKKLQWQKQFDRMMESSTQLTQKLLQEERSMFADIEKEMDDHLENYRENLDKKTQATIDAETEKKKAAREALEWQMWYATESGMQAVENAKTLEDATRGILNSIRDQLKAYLAEFIATAASSALKSVPFPINLIAAAAAGGTANFLFNKMIPEFSQGGHTAPGAKNKPAGIVHAGEYVLPKQALENPNIKSITEVFELARKNGQWHNIEFSPDLASFRQPGFSQGGYTSQPVVAASGTQAINNTSDSNKILDRKTAENLIKVLNRLEKWQPEIYTRTIKKDLDSLNDIEKHRGL